MCEEMLQVLFSSMSEGFAYCRVVLDAQSTPRDFVFVEVNAALERMMRRPAAELLGRGASQVMPWLEKEPTNWIAMLGRVALSGEPVQIESRSSLTGRWYALFASCPRKGYFAVTLSDVTSRHRAEAQQRDAEQRLQREREQAIEFLGLLNEHVTPDALADAAIAFLRRHTGCEAIALRLWSDGDFPYFRAHGFPDAFLACDNELTERDAQGRIQLDLKGERRLQCLCGRVICGTATAEPAHLTPGGSFWTNALGRLARQEGGSDRGHCLAAGFRSVALIPLRVGASRLGLLQLSDRRDGLFTQELVAFMERLAGHLAVALSRSHAESRLRQLTHELEEADRRKNSFLATLSHELRNPLAPIANCLVVLDRAVPGSPPALQAKQILDRQVAHLSRLVDDLLDATRISRNKVHLQRRRLEACELVRRAVDDQRTIFDKAGIELSAEFPGQELWIEADPVRISQVLGNLLQNAAKFTPRGGATRVRVAASDERVVVRVSDTGVGMSCETLARLFQPFVQAEVTLERSGGGLGLGLALVKGLVELHGGAVTAHSEGLGRGSEFVVVLPAVGGESAPR
jgi:signal transduction histidine kinase